MKNIANFGWAFALGLSLILMAGMSAKSEASTATITPTGASDGPEGDFDLPKEAINSDGLSGTLGVGDDALKTHDNNENNDWVTRSDVDVNLEHITFDLGANFDLLGTYIWNENGNVGRGVHTFTIDTSTDGTTFTPLGPTFTLAIAGGGAAEPAQFLAFSASNIQSVRFDILTNWDSPTNGSVLDLVGLSEVRFEAEVPEPASLGLLTTGGALLLGKRRSRVRC